MFAMQLQHSGMMGLGDDGQQAMATSTQSMAAGAQSVANRVASIRERMLAIGIPAAIGTGAVTMLTFAAAFGLARTERVWIPAIWLGAVSTIGALVSVAVAARATEVPPPTTPAPSAAQMPTPTASFYY
jgi:hypothetical protein